MISHSSMLTAQSGPVSASLVALSTNAAALLAMSLRLHYVKSFTFLQTQNQKVTNQQNHHRTKPITYSACTKQTVASI